MTTNHTCFSVEHALGHTPASGYQGLVEPLPFATTSGVHHGIAKGRVAVAGRRALVGDGELAVAGLPARLVLGEIGGTDAQGKEGVEPLLAVLGVPQSLNELNISGGAATALYGAVDGDLWNAKPLIGSATVLGISSTNSHTQS